MPNWEDFNIRVYKGRQVKGYKEIFSPFNELLSKADDVPSYLLMYVTNMVAFKCEKVSSEHIRRVINLYPSALDLSGIMQAINMYEVTQRTKDNDLEHLLFPTATTHIVHEDLL